MAKALGCHLVGYQNWEGGKTEPQVGAIPAIIELLGYLPNEHLDSVEGVLKSARLRRGKNRFEMARTLKMKPEVWTRLECGEYPPSHKDLELLEGQSIDFGSLCEIRPDHLPTALSRALKKARLERGFTQSEIAIHLGYKGNSAWSRVEQGGRIPDRRTWGDIHKLLGVEVSAHTNEGPKT